MPSKLWKLFGQAKSSYIAVSCVAGNLLNYLKQFHSDLFHLDTLRVKYDTKTLVCKQKQRP